MARFNYNEVDNYSSQGNGSFFSLKNDNDVATVRFMYNTMEDVVGHAVHEVEIDGKKRYVNCLRSYSEPIENCPLCEARNKIIAKLFVLLYDVDTEEVKIWDRGKTFFSKISGLCARNNPLISTVFEIERHGKPGDTKTTYEIFTKETDDITLEDLPEVPEILGGLVLDKSYEDMYYYLDEGEFPPEEDEVKPEPQSAPQTRVVSRQNNSAVGTVSRRSNSTANNTPATPVRNTPSNQNQRRRTSTDRF